MKLSLTFLAPIKGEKGYFNALFNRSGLCRIYECALLVYVEVQTRAVSIDVLLMHRLWVQIFEELRMRPFGHICDRYGIIEPVR